MITAFLEPRNATLLIVLAIGLVVLGIGGIFALALIKWFIPGILVMMALAIFIGLGPVQGMPILWRWALVALLFIAAWLYIDNDGWEFLGIVPEILMLMGVG